MISTRTAQPLRSHAHRFTLALVASLLAACGGGGGGGGSGPQPTVDRMSINPLGGDLQSLVVTVEGSNLAQGLSVASPQCTSLTLLSAAPHVSGAAAAFYRCATTVTAPSAVTVSATRSSDAGALASVSFTPGAAPTVTQALAGQGAVAATDVLPEVPGTAKYSQQMTITVTGSNVNQGLDVSSSSCTGMTLSTAPPLVSTGTTAYYHCKVAAVAPLTQAVIALASDTTQIVASPLFVVPSPQVTMTIKRGTEATAPTLGTFVITLKASEAPLTVDNFLGYVNSGFYAGTIFDLIAKNLSNAPLLLGGGAYPPTSGSPPPAPKTAGAPIAFEAGSGLSNVQWSVAMDHLASDINSATTGFIVNLVDNLNLDAAPGRDGYAVFGDVTAGTDLIGTMAASPCQLAAQFSVCLAVPNLVITSAVQTQ